jgi:hypothetical protein
MATNSLDVDSSRRVFTSDTLKGSLCVITPIICGALSVKLKMSGFFSVSVVTEATLGVFLEYEEIRRSFDGKVDEFSPFFES